MYKSDREKERSLAKLLLSSQKGMEFTGMTARQFFTANFGVNIDHHVYTDIMDEMTRYNDAICTQGWGDTRYLIN
jgi:hypothetical protein